MSYPHPPLTSSQCYAIPFMNADVSVNPSVVLHLMLFLHSVKSRACRSDLPPACM